MKVVCIKNYLSQGLQLELTYGKIYEVKNSITTVIPLNDKNYWIKNDRGSLEYYSKSDFITLEEHRAMQLKRIGV